MPFSRTGCALWKLGKTNAPAVQSLQAVLCSCSCFEELYTPNTSTQTLIVHPQQTHTHQGIYVQYNTQHTHIPHLGCCHALAVVVRAPEVPHPHHIACTPAHQPLFCQVHAVCSPTPRLQLPHTGPSPGSATADAAAHPTESTPTIRTWAPLDCSSASAGGVAAATAAAASSNATIGSTPCTPPRVTAWSAGLSVQDRKGAIGGDAGQPGVLYSAHVCICVMVCVSNRLLGQKERPETAWLSSRLFKDATLQGNMSATHAKAGIDELSFL
eukprot:1150478-Pelagomonas_calceolata.AAC.21